MKYVVALFLLLAGCSPAKSKSLFFCLAPMSYQTVDASDPTVTLIGNRLNGVIKIVNDQGTFYVPRSLCVEQAEESAK